MAPDVNWQKKFTTRLEALAVKKEKNLRARGKIWICDTGRTISNKKIWLVALSSSFTDNVVFGMAFEKLPYWMHLDGKTVEVTRHVRGACIDKARSILFHLANVDKNVIVSEHSDNCVILTGDLMTHDDLVALTAKKAFNFSDRTAEQMFASKMLLKHLFGPDSREVLQVKKVSYDYLCSEYKKRIARHYRGTMRTLAFSEGL